MRDNLIPIDGDARKDKTAESLREFKAGLPWMTEHVALVAQLTRAKFLALREQGFTEAQAIELCKTL